MSRLGEGELGHGSYRNATIWVAALSAAESFHPRLAIEMGCQLREIPPDSHGRGGGVADYCFATLGGQLRWANEHGPVLGSLSMPKGLEHARSAAGGSEHQFMTFCDIGFRVLTRVESLRGGAPVRLWMDLHGSWAVAGRIAPIYLKPWPFVVPEDMWLSVLSGVGFHDFDFIEIRRTLRNGATLRPAIVHLQAARRLVAEGRVGTAVGTCRLLLEAVESELRRAGYGAGGLSGFLEQGTDETRAKEYGRIVSAIKQLAGHDHHHFGHDTEFSAAEATTLIRICEALLFLVGESVGSGGSDSKHDPKS